MHEKRVPSFWQDDLGVSLIPVSVDKLGKCWPDESALPRTMHTYCAGLDTEITEMNKTWPSSWRNSALWVRQLRKEAITTHFDKCRDGVVYKVPCAAVQAWLRNWLKNNHYSTSGRREGSTAAPRRLMPILCCPSSFFNTYVKTSPLCWLNLPVTSARGGQLMPWLWIRIHNLEDVCQNL